MKAQTQPFGRPPPAWLHISPAGVANVQTPPRRSRSGPVQKSVGARAEVRPGICESRLGRLPKSVFPAVHFFSVNKSGPGETCKKGSENTVPTDTGHVQSTPPVQVWVTWGSPFFARLPSVWPITPFSLAGYSLRFRPGEKSATAFAHVRAAACRCVTAAWRLYHCVVPPSRCFSKSRSLGPGRWHLAPAPYWCSSDAAIFQFLRRPWPACVANFTGFGCQLYWLWHPEIKSFFQKNRDGVAPISICMPYWAALPHLYTLRDPHCPMGRCLPK